MAISGNGSGSDDFGDDGPTRVDEAFEAITPVELPLCTDCGAVVFLDDFTDIAAAIAVGMFTRGQCVRARDGHWRYCAQAGATGTLVYKPPG